MKTKVLLVLGLFVSACCNLFAAEGAAWITADAADVDQPNRWIAFQKDVHLSKKPKTLNLDIAADSKYWLWVNGEAVVFEGSLKRGPSPESSYYDRIDIAPYLKKGDNRVAVLLWYFGKDGFSHKDSGKAGLIINSSDNERFNTDSSWCSKVYDAYGAMGEPLPNFRLPESSLSFDGNKEMQGWQKADCAQEFGFTPSVETGHWGDKPWGDLVLRPIPQWKDFGLKELEFVRKDAGNGNDSVVARLPYNLQMTPWIDIDDPKGGSHVVIQTDHFKLTEYCLRGEYITRPGRQTYESLGWLSGEKLYLILHKHVKENALKYR
ncbi:MAG: glycoside hydrolase, partial [Muribaculaceae bacterium]|nr:glycoside hydrolase [Muribaculaceae bacterium]